MTSSESLLPYASRATRPPPGQVLVDPRLIVPVDGRDGDEGRPDAAGRDEVGQQRRRCSCAATAKLVRTRARRRPLHVRRRVAQVDVDRAVQRPADVALDVYVDDAADVSSVTDAEPARVEVDLVDQVGREHRRPGQEVVQDRDRLAADEDAGVGRVGAAHDEQARGRTARARRPACSAARAAGRRSSPGPSSAPPCSASAGSPRGVRRARGRGSRSARGRARA